MSYIVSYVSVSFLKPAYFDALASLVFVHVERSQLVSLLQLLLQIFGVVLLLIIDWADRRLKMEDSLRFFIILLLLLVLVLLQLEYCASVVFAVDGAAAVDTTDSKLVVALRQPALWELCKFAFMGLFSKGET